MEKPKALKFSKPKAPMVLSQTTERGPKAINGGVTERLLPNNKITKEESKYLNHYNSNVKCKPRFPYEIFTAGSVKRRITPALQIKIPKTRNEEDNAMRKIISTPHLLPSPINKIRTLDPQNLQETLAHNPLQDDLSKTRIIKPQNVIKNGETKQDLGFLPQITKLDQLIKQANATPVQKKKHKTYERQQWFSIQKKRGRTITSKHNTFYSIRKRKSRFKEVTRKNK